MTIVATVAKIGIRQLKLQNPPEFYHFTSMVKKNQGNTIKTAYPLK